MNNKMNHPLITVDGRTLMDRPLEPPNFVVDTLISQGLHILAGSPKVGKSWLALWLAVTVAKGEPVWNMTTRQGTTLYRPCRGAVRRFAGGFRVRQVNSRKAKETPCWAACGPRRSAGVRRGRITSLEVASIAFVWSTAQPPPAFRLFAGRCPTPHFYERLEETI